MQQTSLIRTVNQNTATVRNLIRPAGNPEPLIAILSSAGVAGGINYRTYCQGCRTRTRNLGHVTDLFRYAGCLDQAGVGGPLGPIPLSVEKKIFD